MLALCAVIALPAKMEAVNAGLFGSVAELKVKSEGYMRLAIQDTDLALPLRLGIEYKFLAAQALCDKMLMQMNGDLAIYTGVIGLRIVRHVKRIDQALYKNTDATTSRSTAYKTMFNEFKKACDDLEAEYKSAYVTMATYKKALADKKKSLNNKDVKSAESASGSGFDLASIEPLTGLAQLTFDIVKSVQESGSKRREAVAAQLEKLRLVYPSAKE